LDILTVLLDLDGVVCRWPHEAVADWEGKADLLRWLTEQERAGVRFRFVPVTNRPGAHLQILCYDFHVQSEICIAESGATAYEPATHTHRLNPSFYEFARDIRPSLRKLLYRKLPIGPGKRYEEECARLVTLEIIARNREHDLPRLVKTLRRLLEDRSDICFESGKSIVLYPPACDKAAGLDWLDRCWLAERGEGLSGNRTLWVADSARDIVAARWVREHDGMIAAVGGSDPSYVAAVRMLDGFCASGSYERGLLEVLQHAVSLRWRRNL
jgi:hypothetical protein